ncbi:MAG: PEP/pyruvate-binding domain-containing protein, partial [Acidimicrobiales bacterium]
MIALDDRRAVDPALVGAKAAALARSAQCGLPVLPGFVVTTGADWTTAVAEIEPAWRALGGHERALVVRSSSTVEDGGTSSMAGMFTSVLDVVGWPAFVEAVHAVLGSAKALPQVEMAPLAVLVQPMLRPRLGGVLFGADPVTGRTDRLVAAVVEGGPDRLVSGSVDGAQYVLTPAGRVLSVERPVAGLGRHERRALAGLAAQVAQLFGGPQDVEWAIEEDGTLRLLQSRPITALGHTEAGRGPVFGPGPVAETFPDPLSPLEVDLWVGPLRRGVAEALALTGAGSRRRLAGSPVVVTVGGRVAADLALLGVDAGPRRFLARFDPRPPARRLRAAWRVGRLRAALPALATQLVDEVDGRLLEVPDLDELSDAELVSLLERAQPVLVALHGHEVLAGLLVAPATPATSGASVALRALAAGRADGLDDDEITGATPAVLA